MEILLMFGDLLLEFVFSLPEVLVACHANEGKDKHWAELQRLHALRSSPHKPLGILP